MSKFKQLPLLTESQEGYGVICEWNTSKGASGFISSEIQDKVILKEFEEKGKDNNVVFMNCILQKCDTENRNGRVYPEAILRRENEKYQILIKEGRALGASDHPDSSLISLKENEVSHRVIKTWWEGNTLMGVLEIMTSQKYHKDGTISCQADFIADLLRRGVKLGISSRGVGSLKNKGGKNLVQDDFELICFDLVASPSTPGAFLYPGEVQIQESINTKNITESQKITKTGLSQSLDEFLS